MGALANICLTSRGTRQRPTSTVLTGEHDQTFPLTPDLTMEQLRRMREFKPDTPWGPNHGQNATKSRSLQTLNSVLQLQNLALISYQPSGLLPF